MESAMEKGANHLSHPIFASMSDWRSCLTVNPASSAESLVCGVCACLSPISSNISLLI